MAELPFMAGEQGRGPLLVFLFFVSATVITVWGTWEGTLPQTEEAVRAEVAREILVTGDWWTMHFDGAPLYDLPPLSMWCTAVFLKLFGTNEFSAHLPFVIFSVLTFYIIFLAGELKPGGRSVSCEWITQPRALGLLSAIILAASPLFGKYAPDLTPHVPFAFFISMAIYGWLLLPESRAGLALWAVGIACGILSGGAGALLLIPGSFLSLVSDRQRRNLWKSPQFLAVTVCALAAGVAWLVPATLRGSGEFAGNQLWTPFSGMGRSFGAAVSSFIVALWELFVRNLPWSIPTVIAVVRILFFRKSGKRNGDITDLDDTLLAFSVVILVPMAIGSAGERSLFLPLLPLAAIIAAREVARWIAAVSKKTEKEPEVVLHRLWTLNQTLTAVFCLFMLLLFATPLRFHRTTVDPIKDIALMAAQLTPEGTRLGNFGQPRRFQAARLLFYGNRSLRTPHVQPEAVLEEIGREPNTVFLATAEQLEELREFAGDGAAYRFNVLYRSRELVLFKVE
ncbi:MAG: glycosyltransferase family 39 protein [bacterium]|nr:MAG: glycosyltransferase family 39 protein [bacterium]